MQKPMTYAILYSRVSSDSQADNTSLPAQLALCTAHAERLGAFVAGTYSDESSGKFFLARPGIQDALAYAERLRKEHPTASVHLVIATLDRAGRSRELETLKARLHRAGAHLDLLDGTPTGKSATDTLLFDVRTDFAKYERLVIAERMARGKAATARAGQQVSRSTRLYGYLIPLKRDVYPGSKWQHSDIGRYQVIEEEAAVVRQVFELYASGSLSLRGIELWLVEQGFATMRGGTWSHRHVYNMLKCPAYKGEARFGASQWESEETHDGLVKRRHRDTPDEAIVIPCPALVSRELWERCQTRLSTNQRTWTGERQHLLSGLALCPCGASLRVRWGNHGKDRYYVCLACKAAQKATGGHARTWSARILEGYALRALAASVVGPQLAHVAAQLRKAVRPGVSGASAAKEMRELEGDEGRLVEMELEARRQGRSAGPYAKRLALLDARRQTLLSQLQAAQSVAEKPEFDLGALVALMGRAEEILTDPDTPAPLRCKAVRTVIRQVVPQDGKEGIEVLIGFHGVEGMNMLVTPSEVRAVPVGVRAVSSERRSEQ